MAIDIITIQDIIDIGIIGTTATTATTKDTIAVGKAKNGQWAAKRCPFFISSFLLN
ncbi:MAG: hypothetical protein ACHQJ6_08315 [Candidatus Berkiellales bacterium]